LVFLFFFSLFKLGPLFLRTLGHPGEPVNEHGAGDVEDNVHPHEAEVAPRVAEVARHGRQESVGARHGAEAAVARGVRVSEVAAGHLDVRVHVLLAGQVAGRVEVEELDVLADDVGARHAGGEHRGDEVREGGDAVHEDPESGHGVGGGKDTAEDQAEREEQVGEVTTSLRDFDTGNDHVRKGRCEHQKCPDEKEHQATTLRHSMSRLRVPVEPDRVVPADEDEDRHERVPREFNDYVRGHKGLPRVRLRGPLASLVKSTLGDEVGHNLLNQIAEDRHEHEDTKHLVLKTLHAVLGLEEREPDVECGEDRESGLGVDVRRCTPVLGENSDQAFPQLYLERGSELPVVIRVGRSRRFLLRERRFQLSQVLADSLALGAIPPDSGPVNISVGSGSRANNFKHPLCRIGVGRQWRSTVSFKIAGEGGRLFSDLSKVDGLATGREEQQTIKSLEEHS